MKKALKNILYLLVCLALVMTLVPTAFADETSSETSAETLTIEDIAGHQPANMITEKLTLPTGYTWSASPAGVINTTTGAVTRKPVEDQEVTLTATKSGGTTKSFTFVVKSKKTKVLIAESFAYDYAEGTNATAQEDFIFKTAKTAVTHSVLKEGSGNSYFHADWTYDASDTTAENNNDKKNSKKLSLRTLPEGINAAEELYISFKYKYVKNAGTLDDAVAHMKLDTESKTDITAASFGFNKYSGNDNKYTFRYAVKSISSSSGWYYKDYTADGKDDWKTAYYKYSLKDVSGAVSEDGVTYKDSVALISDTLTDKALTAFSFAPSASASNCGTVLLDDLIIYTESMDNLTTEEKQEYIDAELDVTDLTAESAGAVTQDLTLPSFDGLVTWESSDTDVISVQGEKGVIGTRDKAIFKTATLTATYGTKTRKFNFAVAPADTTTEILGSKFNTIKLLEDFESVTDDMKVKIVEGNKVDTTTGWTAEKATVEDRNFGYFEDSEKGMVGQLDDLNGATVSLVPGKTAGSQFRHTTGFDFKFSPANETDSFTFDMNGACPIGKIVVTKNKVRVYQDVYTNGGLYTDYTVSTEGWIRVDIDTNMASRTQEIFINGVSLTGAFKNGAYSQQYKSHAVSNSLRFLKFTAKGCTPVYIDNIAAVGHTNDDRSLADAGVKAAQVFYSDYISQPISQSKALEKTGPVLASAQLTDSTTFAATGGASLTWSGIGVTEYTFFPSAAGGCNLTVTAASGEETATGSVSLNAAPVVLAEDSGKITVTKSDDTSGVLIVAEYDSNGRMTAATQYNSFTDVAAPTAYKAFFVRSLQELIPLAFPLIK